MSTLRIAVIGGTGQVGGAIVRQALASGHGVLSLDRGGTGPDDLEGREGYEYKQLDATDFEAYKAAVKGCEALIHLPAVYNLHDDDGNVLKDVGQQFIHNTNVAMSYNALVICAQLGINRVVLASSVNAVGLIYTPHPQYDYLPIDENHTCRPLDAYSLCKVISEVQADSIAAAYPSMRIASMRFHMVVPDWQATLDNLDERIGSWKDLWGWVSEKATAEACLKALTVPESQFPLGHEAFFVAAKTICQKANSMELLRKRYPEEIEFRSEIKDNASFFDTTKAERMLGWKEEGFVYRK